MNIEKPKPDENAEPEVALISERVESIIGTALNISMIKSMIEGHVESYRDPQKKEWIRKGMTAELLSRLREKLEND